MYSGSTASLFSCYTLTTSMSRLQVMFPSLGWDSQHVDKPSLLIKTMWEVYWNELIIERIPMPLATTPTLDLLSPLIFLFFSTSLSFFLYQLQTQNTMLNLPGFLLPSIFFFHGHSSSILLYLYYSPITVWPEYFLKQPPDQV